VPEIGIHLTLRLRELRLHVLLKNAGMCSKISKDEMCMPEEQEVGLFVIAFVFIDLCL